MKQYDYLIVGAGLFGATFAYLAKQAGKRCLVIDKRPHTGGNAYCEDIESQYRNGTGMSGSGRNYGSGAEAQGDRSKAK